MKLRIKLLLRRCGGNWCLRRGLHDLRAGDRVIAKLCDKHAGEFVDKIEWDEIDFEMESGAHIRMSREISPEDDWDEEDWYAHGEPRDE